ncbi:hypothetical protein HK405_002809, partial [Cladochytrium tenue]
ALVVAYIAVAFAAPGPRSALAALGQLLCEVVAQAIKHLVRQPRPTQFLGKGYGMPSSHAQFMAFFAVQASLLVIFRVHLYYHTTAQVLTGLHIGVLLGVIWFLACERVILPALTTVSTSNSDSPVGPAVGSGRRKRKAQFSFASSKRE